MKASRPHYLLFSEGTLDDSSHACWKFTLQAVGSEEHFSAADAEEETRTSRLELLAVVRGLEALDQPSRVTLLTRSRYVRRGIRRELAQWRERRWRWERFGNVVPIRDHDLWQRIDRAMQFHQIECCAWASQRGEKSQASARSHAANQGSTVGKQIAPNVAAVWGGLRRAVLTPLQAIWRQPFTPAA